jgi:hypothetical protein
VFCSETFQDLRRLRKSYIVLPIFPLSDLNGKLLHLSPRDGFDIAKIVSLSSKNPYIRACNGSVCHACQATTSVDLRFNCRDLFSSGATATTRSTQHAHESRPPGAKVGMSEEPQQIPTCQQCRLRKIRCDHAAPKCGACVKSSSACIIVDPMTKKQYTRDYIHDLECKEKDLKARLDDSTRSPQDARQDPSPVHAHSIESTTTFSGYVGESSGLRYA